MSRQKYDVDVLEMADDDSADASPHLLHERTSAPRRWQTEMRHRPRRSASSQARSGLHQRKRKPFSF